MATTKGDAYSIIISIGLAAALLFSFAVFSTTNVSFASSSPNTVSANVVIPNYCGLSLVTNVIAFAANAVPPGVAPGSSAPTSNVITDTNLYGNINANVFVAGGNWLSGGNIFTGGSTEWSASYQTTYTGTPLTSTNVLVETVTASSPSNNIFFGVAVPAGQAVGTYTQNIVIENSCFGGTGTPNTLVTATVNVIAYCGISLSVNAINFGTINPGSNTGTTSNQVMDTNSGGNTGASLWASGGNWLIGGSFGFSGTNTVYGSTSSNTYSWAATNSPLMGISANTGIVMASSSSSNVFFGLAIPGGTAAGTYAQNIIIVNTC